MSDPLWTIDATLKKKGFTFVRPPSVYRGPIAVHGNKAQVEIEIPDISFAILPTVRLVDRATLSATTIAHLNLDDTICYVGQGGLPLDLYNPGGSVLRVLRETEIALERSFGRGAAKEFEIELASYWNGTSILVDLPIESEHRIDCADVVEIKNGSASYLAIVESGRWEHLRPRSRCPVTILYFANPLQYGRAFKASKVGEVLDWLDSQVAGPKNMPTAVVQATAAKNIILVVAPNAMIGWRPVFPASLEAIRRSTGVRKHFFEKQVAKSLNEIDMDRLTGLQFDLGYVVKRNLLNRPSLIGRRVSLVGAGTIGGNLAKLLIQSGAGCQENFTIYDTDTLRPGNLGRHVLGFAHLNEPKVAGVSELLRSFHPDVQVKPVPRDALKEWESLERSDLIIDTTGDYNVSTALNHLYMRSEKHGRSPALIHAWVNGNGIAAQTFLNLKDNYGCYRCLKPTFDGPWRYDPVKDAKRLPTVAPAICGESGYLPFAADAPIAAASLALRAILDWVEGKAIHRLRTITLNYDDGKDVKWVSPSRIDGCPACGSRR